VTREKIVKAYIRYKVTQLLENQQLDPKRIGKVDQYTTALPLLDKSLRILMSPQYKSFMKDIQIISPKPSTYKVTLNNDYFFYLKYNRGTVTANIEGKNYSLLTVDEAQRASNAVTELLKFTSAIISKQESDGSENELNSMESGGFASGGSSGSSDLPPESANTAQSNEDNPDPEIDAILGDK
jgi:hypothetical protein